jgi:hypothetical protein
MLLDNISKLSTDFGYFRGEISAMQSAAAGMQTRCEEIAAQETQIVQKLKYQVAEDFQRISASIEKKF